jgi:uncharacterized repeat protein (TIGR01451 family)
MKEVYPRKVYPGYEDWLYYTIHFQNVGNAPAFNIKITDILDYNLITETFQLLNYSHSLNYVLNDNKLNFVFPNIMLSDSTSDSEGSKGYVQFRLKPTPNLPKDTEIQNYANIYFDFNPPIITNTVVTYFEEEFNSVQDTNQLSTIIYPNPTNNQLNIKSENALGEIVVYDLSGREVLRIKNNQSQTSINVGSLTNGLYLIKVNNQSFKFVIMH